MPTGQGGQTMLGVGDAHYSVGSARAGCVTVETRSRGRGERKQKDGLEGAVNSNDTYAIKRESRKGLKAQFPSLTKFQISQILNLSELWFLYLHNKEDHIPASPFYRGN